MIKVRKRSSNVQRWNHVPGITSTPPAVRRRQPGGRFKEPDTDWKSWSQPTAGNLFVEASYLDSATRSSFPLRSSTPGFLSLPWPVMSWSVPSTDTRPRIPGGFIARYHWLLIVPWILSWIVNPLPLKLSHQVFFKWSWSGAGSGSPRRISLNVIALPEFMIKAGNLFHSEGISVWLGSTDWTPSVLTIRRWFCALKAHISWP